MKTGIELITEERQKQIDKHGFTAEHHALNSEKWYSENQLTVCAGLLLYRFDPTDAGLKDAMIALGEPQLKNWDLDWFKNMMERSDKERLIISGALIAAELDRLNYVEENNINGRV